MCKHVHTCVSMCKCVQSLQPLQEPDTARRAHAWLRGGRWDPSPEALGSEVCAGGEERKDTAVLGMEELGPAVWEGADCLPSITEAGTSPTWPHFSLHLRDRSISLLGGSGWKLEQKVLSSLLTQPLASVFKLDNSANTQKLTGHHHHISPASHQLS